VGLRFRRSFRIVPGWRVNVSESGVSSSFGRRGAWFTIGPRGTRETLGIPGTGVSYTTDQRAHREPPKSDEQHRRRSEFVSRHFVRRCDPRLDCSIRASRCALTLHGAIHSRIVTAVEIF
jgi:hypothetical protein